MTGSALSESPWLAFIFEVSTPYRTVCLLLLFGFRLLATVFTRREAVNRRTSILTVFRPVSSLLQPLITETANNSSSNLAGTMAARPRVGEGPSI